MIRHEWKKLCAISLLAGAMLVSTASPVRAADDAELAALKAQLDMLTKKIEKLEQENVAAKQAAAQTAAYAPALAAVAPAAGSSSPATAPTAPAKTENAPVVGGATPGSFKLPGSDTSVKLGGYVKLDTIYDFKGAGNNDQVNFAGIPLDTAVNANDNEFRMHARESRINLQTDTPTKYGNLKTFIEADFYGGGGTEISSNGHTFRLRQAYAEIGPWLLGQTWSNFTDVPTNVPTVEFTGTVGRTSIRQPQITYTSRIADKTNLSFSVENSFGDAQTDTGAALAANIEDLPDVTVKYLMDKDWGRLVLRGMGGKFDARSAAGNEETAYRYGVGFATKLKVPDTKDAVFLDATYGDGIGRYLNDAGGQGATYNLTTGNMENQVAYGGYAAYQHTWSDTVTSNLMYGMLRIDNPAFAPATVNKSLDSVHANVFWQPIPKIKVGLEYVYGHREIENGTEGDLHRAQAGVWYFF